VVSLGLAAAFGRAQVLGCAEVVRRAIGISGAVCLHRAVFVGGPVFLRGAVGIRGAIYLRGPVRIRRVVSPGWAVGFRRTRCLRMAERIPRALRATRILGCRAWNPTGQWLLRRRRAPERPGRKRRLLPVKLL
jgi:hypothetical protein